MVDSAAGRSVWCAACVLSGAGSTTWRVAVTVINGSAYCTECAQNKAMRRLVASAR